MNSAKILFVEDDAQARRALRRTLAGSGYTVIEARTGQEVWEEFREDGAVDAILLKMPGLGAVEVCRRIRRTSEVPILVIGGTGTTQDDKVQAFDAGADDYIAKPFGIQELLSRIHALRRRASGSETGSSFESADLKIDFERRRVSVKNKTIHLTRSEFQLLRYLVLNEGKPVPYDTLLPLLWGAKRKRDVQPLRVLINQLRRKIELDSRSRYIHTENQFGYRFEPGVRKSAQAKRKK